MKAYMANSSHEYKDKDNVNDTTFENNSQIKVKNTSLIDNNL